MRRATVDVKKQRRRRKSKTPPKKVKEYLDGDPRKKSPVGLLSTMAGIQYYWPSLSMGMDQNLSLDAFCVDAKFFETMVKVVSAYPSGKKKLNTLGGVKQAIGRITNQTKQVEFVHLRAYAEYVGLPTALFVLFARLVSDERNLVRKNENLGRRKDEIGSFLQKIIDVLVFSKKELSYLGDDELLFNHRYDEYKEEYDSEGRRIWYYMAKIASLKNWSVIFNRSEKS